MKTNLTCILVDDEPMARNILESYIQKLDNLTLVKSCKNALEAFEVLNKNQIDIIFLDINMPEISGLSFAKSINSKAHIVFTTAYREFALDGFDLEATDYLLKPISFERFMQSFQKIINIKNNIAQEKSNKLDGIELNFIFVRSDRKMIKIDLKDILCIESLSDYVKIKTTEKTIITRETISNLENKIGEKHFLRIHRSYIINVNKIDSYTNEFIEINSIALPISRTYKEKVLSLLQNI